MVMTAKITQKRGRRTDSVSLDLEALSKSKGSDFDISMGYHDRLFDISISLADINLSISMDKGSMELIGGILAIVSPNLIDAGKSMGGTMTSQEKDLYDLLNKIVHTSPIVDMPKDEECTPCQQKAQEGLADYFDRLIQAYETDPSSVDSKVRKAIQKIRTFARDLRAGNSVAKKAFVEANDFLTDFP